MGGAAIYRPRAVVHRGVWAVGHLRVKVYGLLAEGKDLTPAMVEDARAFAERDLPRRALGEGEDDGLGFVVIHPGDLGMSVLGHWWMQGSVLCQRIRRRLWDAAEPMDADSRPVIACVWELALIDAERRIWTDTMMGVRPDPAAYLSTRAPVTAV